MQKGKRRYLFGPLIILISLVFTGSSSQARTLHDSLYLNPNEVEFYLHTTDAGNRVYDNYGHVAIRVVDRLTGTDLVYNWGVFDFSNPVDFSFNFYKDILWYKLGIAPLQHELQRYKWEQRRVIEDRINLTTEQKTALINILKWNAKPENLRYQYHYFFDNCSTRPRDYLDKALKGRIHESTKDEQLEESFRDMVMSHNATLPGIDTGLDILMNSNIDKKMTLWEQAFLPKYLRNILLSMASDVMGDDGPLPLISESRLIIDVPEAGSADNRSLSIMIMYIFIPLVFAALGLFFPWNKLRVTRRGEDLIAKSSYRLLGWAALVFGIYTGIVGVAMPLNWWLSGHLDLHHNVNILVFWPVDFFLVIFGWHWLLHGQAYRVSHRYWTWIKRYSFSHILVTISVSIIWILGGVDQYLGRIVVYFVPISIVLFSLLGFRGLQTKKK